MPWATMDPQMTRLTTCQMRGSASRCSIIAFVAGSGAAGVGGCKKIKGRGAHTPREQDVGEVLWLQPRGPVALELHGARLDSSLECFVRKMRIASR